MPVIDSILQLPQVKSSSYVRLKRFFTPFLYNYWIEDDDVQHQHSLQIDVISDWLHQQVLQTPLSYYRTLEILPADGRDEVVRLDSVERLIDTLQMVNWCLF